MGDGMLSKFREFKGFLGVVRDLGAIFEKGDKKAFNEAVKAGDFKAACKALHMGDYELTEKLRHGAVKAAKIVRESPDLAIEAIKQHGTNGQRS